MEEDIQFGVLRIGTYSDESDDGTEPEREERVLPSFQPKSFSAYWYEQVDDDPSLFNPLVKRDLDQFISLKMRKADHAYCGGNYAQCIKEIESLQNFVPNTRRTFLLSSYSVVSLCHYHLNNLHEAEVALKNCLDNCDTNEDFTSCIDIWRKLASKDKQKVFFLDLIAIHFDPQNFFTLFNIATCEQSEVLTTVHDQSINLIKLRLLLRVKYLTHSAMTNNRSFFAQRYTKLHEAAKTSIENTLSLEESATLGENALADAEKTERSVGSLFTPCKLPTKLLSDLFQKNFDSCDDEVDFVLKSFVKNYLSYS